MIKFNFVAFILVFVTSFNCKTEQNKTTLIFNLESTGIDHMEVFSIVKDLTYDLSGAKDSIILDLKEEAILDLYQGRYHSYIHVKPGDNLLIDTVSAIPITLGVIGNPSPENKYLDAYWRLEQESSYSYMIPEISKMPVDSFKLQIEAKNKSLEELITKIKRDDKVSTSFKNTMKNRYVATLSNDLSYYKDFYFHHYKEYPVIPSDYYESIEAVEITDPSLLIFEEGRQIVSNYHSRNLSYEDYISLTDFYIDAIKSAKGLYGNSLVSKYCNYEILTKMVNFGGGIDEAMVMIDEFKANLAEHYFNINLAKLIAPWERLLSGSPAPDFIATTIDGSLVKLSDLKGSRVYIDIWATWCGPCIAEIPALKKLEEELSGENINFVSISIDESKDMEKWKTFVTKKELTGMQLMADGAWQSDIATAYNIKGIPRFLLIDEHGMIISANAPRPSSNNIKKLLLD